MFLGGERSLRTGQKTKYPLHLPLAELLMDPPAHSARLPGNTDELWSMHGERELACVQGVVQCQAWVTFLCRVGKSRNPWHCAVHPLPMSKTTRLSSIPPSRVPHLPLAFFPWLKTCLAEENRKQAILPSCLGHKSEWVIAHNLIMASDHSEENQCPSSSGANGHCLPWPSVSSVLSSTISSAPSKRPLYRSLHYPNTCSFTLPGIIGFIFLLQTALGLSLQELSMSAHTPAYQMPSLSTCIKEDLLVPQLFPSLLATLSSITLSASWLTRQYL